MSVVACNGVLYGTIFLSLLSIDCIMGNGFVDMFSKILCKITCFVKRTIREEATIDIVKEAPLNFPVLVTEIILLSFTITMIKTYKKYKGKDKINELLLESKDAITQINEFLEKWRLRRINYEVPTNDYSYLDEEPQEIKPLKLEVPILHMAIIDTLGTTRSRPERGDAGDTINIIDSAILSVTSLPDEDLESISELSEERLDEKIDYSTRYLWDVMEEDANNLDEI